MPSESEYNQFRRLIGDYGVDLVDDSEIDSYLDDATKELTADFTNTAMVSSPVTDFDVLVAQYHPEVIYKAAINWWWDKLAKLSDKHSQSVGQTAQNVGEKWDRAMQMIDKLQARYDEIQHLGTDITFGNISRFSKASLMRHGGIREEQGLK